MKVRVREGNVKYRSPWYIVCSVCGNIIRDSSPELVTKRARQEGWVYDTEKDETYCPNCENDKIGGTE